MANTNRQIIEDLDAQDHMGFWVRALAVRFDDVINGNGLLTMFEQIIPLIQFHYILF